VAALATFFPSGRADPHRSARFACFPAQRSSHRGGASGTMSGITSALREQPECAPGVSGLERFRARSGRLPEDGDHSTVLPRCCVSRIAIPWPVDRTRLPFLDYRLSVPDGLKASLKIRDGWSKIHPGAKRAAQVLPASIAWRPSRSVRGSCFRLTEGRARLQTGTWCGMPGVAGRYLI